ncbi:zf-HC2 domain-containing protein [Corynebacterium atypicum]|uniref:zf-HC2 domain-containing protein n=1 Tax=Corynebacterium atypicum TaxID=191610 RepID=UPI00068EB6DD|nr:zf-HC2 domain-containing protein [Corynebacterium atypicum]
MIEHDAIQAEISARLDGEPGVLADDVVAAHVEGCPECTQFLQRATRLKRIMGGAPAEGAPGKPGESPSSRTTGREDSRPHTAGSESVSDEDPGAESPASRPEAERLGAGSVPGQDYPLDMTDAILAEVETEWRRAAGARQAWLAASRVGLVVAGVVFAVWAVATVIATSGLSETPQPAAVLSPDAQPELAAMLGQAAAVRLATAVALFFGAWRPRILPGFLVFMSACTMFNLGFAMRDLVLDLAGVAQVTGLMIYAVTTAVIAIACWLSYGVGRWGGWRVLGAGPSQFG